MFDDLKNEVYNGREIFFIRDINTVIALTKQSQEAESIMVIGVGSTKEEAFENAKQNLTSYAGGYMKRTSKGMAVTGQYAGKIYGKKYKFRD